MAESFVSCLRSQSKPDCDRLNAWALAKAEAKQITQVCLEGGDDRSCVQMTRKDPQPQPQKSQK